MAGIPPFWRRFSEDRVKAKERRKQEEAIESKSATLRFIYDIETEAREAEEREEEEAKKEGELAQLARASALHAEGQRFESVILHNKRPEVRN